MTVTSEPTTTAERTTAFDVEAARAEFPALAMEVNGHPLAYLDNAATAQKPRAVITALERAYTQQTSNAPRCGHPWPAPATLATAAARAAVARYLGVEDPQTIVFTRGTTEGVNLVAQSFLRPRLESGSKILLTGLEHHSNIVPWQLVAEERGAQIVVAPIDGRGVVDLEAFERHLQDGASLAAVAQVSNALGTVNPVAEMAAMARKHGVPILVDGAQAAPHGPQDVEELNCDFYAFSGHKAFGPTGIGALWGRAEHLEAMPPWQGGGEMIRQVSFEGTSFAEPPARFEAGTPNIAGAIGLGAAVEYLEGLDWSSIHQHEAALVEAAVAGLDEIPGVRLIGTAARRSAVVSFLVDGVHAHDVGQVLDREGIAVRVGHHCAQPVMQHFGIAATARASFAFYNTHGEVHRFLAGVHRVREIFS